MHAVLPLLNMVSNSDDNNNNNMNDADAEKQRRLDEIEARAVDKAKIAADAAFRPSPSILNARSAAVLLQQVDGPPLDESDGKESVYVGRSIPVTAGDTLTVPIQVTTPGSVVEYAVELKSHDISFGIVAEREEGITIVRDQSRVSFEETPLTQKFLVGTVPCLIQFQWDNSYSWMREKIVSYKITVTPPSRESLAAGRRRRAAACWQAVSDDLETAQARLQAATQQKNATATRIEQLMQQLQEQKKVLAQAEKEEEWLKERLELRVEQQKLLKDRLEHGWEDEKEDKTKK